MSRLRSAASLQQRITELLHVVFTIPEPLAAIAFHNKATLYRILFRTAAETLLTLARDPKHLGAEIGFFAVLHTWGQNLHLHPHLHCVVPGGGLSPDGEWIACRPGFFLPVRVLIRLFRRLFLEALQKAYADGQLHFFGELEALRHPPAFARYPAPLREIDWVVYAKPPFGGPQHVLEYLGRYTHRVAISNSRLLELRDGHGFLANCHRAGKLEFCRQCLATPCSQLLPRPADLPEFCALLTSRNLRLCPKCGVGTMIQIEILSPCHGPLPLPVDTS